MTRTPLFALALQLTPGCNLLGGEATANPGGFEELTLALGDVTGSGLQSAAFIPTTNGNPVFLSGSCP